MTRSIWTPAFARFGASFELLANAMTAHPELVSGTGRNDLAFMQAGRGDWVTKVGADGVQVVASRSRGEALALKVADGNKLALFAATVEALDQLGWLDARQREALRPWRHEAIASIKGAQVGARRAVPPNRQHGLRAEEAALLRILRAPQPDFMTQARRTLKARICGLRHT